MHDSVLAPPATARRLASTSAAETRALGAALAAHARPGDVLCLWGELGAGKTQLAKGFAAGLGVENTVVSPTFILMAEYQGRLPLFHVDLYRLEDSAAVTAGGLLDERQREGVTLVEWPDRLGDALPGDRCDVWIGGEGDDPRTITLVATPGHEHYLAAAP